MNINTNILRNIANFLADNESYGDNWSEEVAEMNKLIEYIDVKNGHYYFPPYETILSTCLEDMSEDDAYIIFLPLGYRVRFVFSKSRDIIWAEFYDEDDNSVIRVQFWGKRYSEWIRQSFEYYLDHFYDDIL